MTRLILSDDLNVITAEIKMLERSMKASMVEHSWDIGQRLVHVKETLVHGEFTGWLEANFEFSQRYAQEFMKLYKEYPHASSHLKELPWTHVRKLMSLNDSQAFIEEPHYIPSIDKEIPVSEMSTRQLDEAIKLQKEAERRAGEAEKRECAAKEQSTRFSEELRNRPVIEKVVPLPSDRMKIQSLEKQLADAEHEAEVYKRKANLNEEEAKKFSEMKKQISYLNQEKSDLHRQIESATALSGLSVKIDNFLKTELSPIRYSRALERLDSEVAVSNLTDIIQSVERWCDDMKRYLPDKKRIIVEVAN